MIFGGNFSHKSLLFDVAPYIGSLQIIWNGIQYDFFFSTILVYQLIQFFNLKSPL